MIRKATIQDASRIAEILIFTKRMTYCDIFCDYKVSFCDMQVLPLALEFINNPTKLNDIYVFEDIVVKGMIKITQFNSFIEISDLYIDPFFKSQGIGGKFIKYVDNLAISLHSKHVQLWVLDKNIYAKNFYEKHNFTYCGEKKLENGTTEYLDKYQKNVFNN